jgi:hypothetical protein
MNSNPAPQALVEQAKAQTSANRYALLVRTANAKLIEKIRTS